ncbi:hypothetical protein [Polyangium aurulentum]|uniref:hypothetical protein n=1 Tax=Polyangium aurulentum TaxID=2567896 RepID=UPI0010AED60A|nr:hypothetical protein [Polyangium aurulentum]UQA62148.1 hypothetical protein E8A73_017435 [Polyangium aurulentum]
MIPSSSARVVHPSMVLGAYLERLVRGRRVAVLGDATIGLAERLVERGARLVHAYDPDAARTSEAIARGAGDRARHVSHAVLGGDLGVRDGAFDLVVVPDLSIFADPAELLRRARKLAGASGVTVVASPNPEASRRLLEMPRAAGTTLPTYYELYDLVSLQFPIVKMIGQAPFVGYTVADFAAGANLEVSVDTSLLEATEEPEWFIAIASEKKVAVDSFMVVEMSLADVREALGTGARRALSPASTDDKVALAEALARIAVLTAELEAQQERRREDARQAEVRGAGASAANERITELEAQIAKLRDVDARAGDSHVRAERLTHQIRDMEEELRRQRDRATKLAKQLDDEKKARTKAEVELGLARGRAELPGAKERIEQLTAELGEARGRVVELAVDLEAARARAAELEAESGSSRTRMGDLQERIAHLEAALKEPDPSIANRVAELEAAVARSEAQRSAAARRVESLEEALADAIRGRDDLVAKNIALEKRCADLTTELDTASSSLTPELDALEARLRERGHRITQLERELREGLRVGKELLEQLQERGFEGAPDGSANGEPGTPEPEADPSDQPPPTAAAPVLPGPVASGPSEVVVAQLDTLASRAARAEADLKAAEWRIAQLEHMLVAEERGYLEPATVELQLEQALMAAQQEIASLRRASGPEGGHVGRGVIEQAVLLHQVANELDRMAP